MNAIHIAAALEEIAPVELQESWDNSGFSVGDTRREVKSAILALDCTPEVVEEAIRSGADMIITHHPLIFKGIKRITESNNLEKMVASLIKNDIIVYSAHTNIDKVMCGVSGVMADKIGLKDREILSVDSNEMTGLGIVGDLISETDPADFVRHVKSIFGAQVVRCSKLLDRPVKRVALCGGSGASLIESARSKGAQVYITGDISYHNFFCEDGFMLMDIGHFESESGVLEVMAAILRKKLPTFAVRKSDNNNNPIYYY